jgi:uncharacterized protein YecE (DUF72 family)
VDREKVKSFLQSQDTSIKSEKGETRKNMQQILKPAYNVEKNEVKYIQISEEELPQLNEVIDLQKVVNERRQVSWADEENIKLNIGGNQQEEKPSIFSKLKMRVREKTGETSLSPFENVLETNLKATKDEELKMLYKKVDDLSNKIDEIFEFIKNTNKNKIDENII